MFNWNGEPFCHVSENSDRFRPDVGLSYFQFVLETRNYQGLGYHNTSIDCEEIIFFYYERQFEEDPDVPSSDAVLQYIRLFG